MTQIARVIAEVKKAVVGKDQVLIRAMLAIVAGGHILLEDIPGVGKTTLALAFSKALALECRRMQFTPDVLPSDVTGFSIYDKAAGSMKYQPGAVLCNLFLADELNRASSRTQSALLEAMEEEKVTVDGVTHAVPRPFIVIATQNPAGASGTQLLPDSQLDRFMICLTLGYPTPQEEIRLLQRRQRGGLVERVQPVLDAQGLLELREEARRVYISDEVLDYIVRLTGATRSCAAFLQGASPRATLAAAAMARAAALSRGADYVTPDDVKKVFSCTIAHRLLPAPQTADPVAALEELMRGVAAPRLR